VDVCFFFFFGGGGLLVLCEQIALLVLQLCEKLFILMLRFLVLESQHTSLDKR